MKAMLLAAGLGTRLAPFTHHHPKALAPIGSQTLLEWNIRYLQRFGIREVIVNVHHFADQIEQAIHESKGWGSVVTTSDERDAVLETGGGLLRAAPFFQNESHFVVMNVDVLTNLDLAAMIAAHEQQNSLATLAVMQRTSSRYLLFDQHHCLCGWRNEKTGELRGSQGAAFAFSGVQIVSSQLLSGIRREGKFSLIDVYLDAMTTGCIQAFNHSGGKFLDAGSPASLEQAQTLFSD